MRERSGSIPLPYTFHGKLQNFTSGTGLRASTLIALGHSQVLSGEPHLTHAKGLDFLYGT